MALGDSTTDLFSPRVAAMGRLAFETIDEFTQSAWPAGGFSALTSKAV